MDDVGIDLDAVSQWMDTQDLPPGEIQSAVALGGGTQNVLVRFERGGRSFIVRRGPRHLRPKSNHAIAREMRVLQALAGTDVAHPAFIAGCTDTAVLGDAVFYLMEPVDGFNPTSALEPLHHDPAVQHQMGLSAARAAARLGSVDHVAVGLGDLGNPDGFLTRQPARWLGELEGYQNLDGYAGQALPGVLEVAAWLDGNCPQTWTPGIVHGDFHLANLMYEHDTGEVAAIIDWEMCTIGDPLLDLGWLLASRRFHPEICLPRAAELIAAYSAHSDRDLSAIGWYRVLACFKLAVILEGTHARATAGLAPKETGDMLHGLAVTLLHQAVGLIR